MMTSLNKSTARNYKNWIRANLYYPEWLLGATSTFSTCSLYEQLFEQYAKSDNRDKYLLQNISHINKRIYISQTKHYYENDDDNGNVDDYNDDF